MHVPNSAQCSHYASRQIFRNLQPRREEQRIESERSGRGEHRRGVRGVAVRIGFRHSRGDSGILLEFEEECSIGPAIAVLGDGGGAEIRGALSRLPSTPGTQTQLRKVQPGAAHLRSFILWPAASLWGNLFISFHCWHYD